MAFRKVLLIALIVVSGNLVFGQLTNDRFGISFKMGLYSNPSSKINGGGVIGGEMNTTFNKIAFSIDYYHFEELIFFGDSPAERYNQFGFMIGKNHDSQNKLYSIQLQGGLAPMWGEVRTDFLRKSKEFLGNDIYNTEDFFTVGAVFKMGFKFKPLEELGIGFDIQGNINRKRSAIMFMVNIELGKLR